MRAVRFRALRGTPTEARRSARDELLDQQQALWDLARMRGGNPHPDGFPKETVFEPEDRK